MDSWRAQDTVLLLPALTAIYADTESQKRLQRRGGFETNPLLGKHPSGQELDHAALLTALLGTGIAAAAPKSMRAGLLGGWTGFEAKLAEKNNRMQNDKDFLESLAAPLLAGAITGLLADHFLSDDSGLQALFNWDKGPSFTLTKRF